MSTITYKYGDLEEVVDYSGEGSKIVLEKNPFLIENMKVQSYSDGNSNAYYPLQLIDMPGADMTLTATMVNAGRVQIRNGNVISDVSDMVLNVVQKKGKNQPFSYVVLTLSRQLFIDANIEMVQKSTEFLLNIYGITGTWIYERLEDNGATYDITLVNRAYYLKNITLLSLFNFTVSNDTISLTNLGLTNIPITWTDDEGSFTISFDSKSLTVKLKRNTYSVSGVSQTDYSLTKISNCNPDDLFYFLAKYVAGYINVSDIDIEPGFYYNVSSLSNIGNTYIMQDIEDLKNGAKNTITSEPLLTSVSLRLDEFCWDILQSLAYLSNREIIFDDKAYFKAQYAYTVHDGYVNFTSKNDYIGLFVDGTTVDKVLVTPDNVDDTDFITLGQTIAYDGERLSIDWEPPTNPQTGVTYITTMALSENDDQGSQYLTASQKVVSEAYETTVAISDTTSTYVGQDIKYLAVDDTGGSTANPNSNRNAQAKIVALNALIKNFKPGDCVEYSINETTVPDNNGNEISSWDDFSTVENTDCFLFKTMLPGTSIVAIETYYVKKDGVWFEYDTDNPLRDAGFNVDACVASITDAHNNIMLTDVPLALKTVEYPACVTTYTWGNPEFMDEQSQFNDLAAVSQDSVLDNTSDTGISSGDATKLVVGNQYVHQLRDDRAGFTGLIMEKNVDNNVYRLVGYNQGIVQAQFNSEGKIEVGAGVAQLDEDGLTIHYDSNDTVYNPQNALKFQKIDLAGTDSSGNPLTPYRLFAKYDGTSRTTTSVVQAQSQQINNSNYPAILEMMCDGGGAQNTPVTVPLSSSYTIPANGSVAIVSNISTHSIMVGAGSNTSSSLKLRFSGGTGVTAQTLDLPSPNTAIVTSLFPGVYTTVSLVNTTSSSVTLDMTGWNVSYMYSNGDGAKFTLSSSGTIVNGDTVLSGNVIQNGGTIEFRGPDNGGPFSAVSPAVFRTPIFSDKQIASPIIRGTDQIIGNQIIGNTIYSQTSTTNNLLCRNIAILPNGSYPSNPHAGDILLWY